MKLKDFLTLVHPDTVVRVIDLTYVIVHGPHHPDNLYQSSAFRNYAATADVVSVYPDTVGRVPELVIECK